MSNKPQRIQRRRSKGWKMPENCVYVGRPTKWGNPFTIAAALEFGRASTREEAKQLCVVSYKDWITKACCSEWWFHNGVEQHYWIVNHLHLLRGKDLACWCPLGDDCHADFLLELANK